MRPIRNSLGRAVAVAAFLLTLLASSATPVFADGGVSMDASPDDGGSILNPSGPSLPTQNP